jgi:Ca-activated chloride channel homolog
VSPWLCRRSASEPTVKQRSLDKHLSLSSLVVLTPHRAGLRAGQDNTVDVLVRIQAPDAPVGHTAVRPPQTIALVIDRSGSMGGRPLAEAQRCAAYVVGKLRRTDCLSLVQFEGRVRHLWPAVPLGDGAPLRAAITAIQAGGNTNLHGGWQEGAQTLADVVGNALKRVIVLSDGQANECLIDPAAVAFKHGRS